MALVALIAGINVGGHRRFRPTLLARELARLDTISVGAAGTFVVRSRVGEAELRAEILRRLPFAAEVMVCEGGEVLDVLASDPFEGEDAGADVVPFVGVLAAPREAPGPLPLTLPPAGRWCLKVRAWRGRFVVGVHRREMKAIRCLAQLARLADAPMTVRGWSTMRTVARVLTEADPAR